MNKVMTAVWTMVGWLALLNFSFAQGTDASRPNIILLFADDMGYGDASAYGNPSIKTPSIDQLAREGQLWTNFYATAPLCSPSRGSLLTGQVPVRSGLYGRRQRVVSPGSEGGMPDDAYTMAEGLSAAGYSTIALGKWHLGDMPEHYPTRHGFDEWLGLPYSNDYDYLGEGGFAVARLSTDVTEWNLPLIHSVREGASYRDSVERPVDQSTLTTVYTEAAVEYIRARQSDERPFFLYLPYQMPHAPLLYGEAFKGQSMGGIYGDAVEEIDWSVSQVIAALDEAGLTENTLVIFSSDHGPWYTDQGAYGGSNGPFSGYKTSTWEGGVRVPALFRWPGTISPGTIYDIGTLMDIYSTALGLAGASIPGNIIVDSVDLSPVLKNTGPDPRDSLPYYAAGELRAYRKGDYKIHFITTGEGGGGQKVYHETPLLFNVRVDPREEYNIAEQEPEILQDLVEAARRESSFEWVEPIFDR